MPIRTVWLLLGLCLLAAGLAPEAAAQQPSIPFIVKDKTSFYWQAVLAGARKAGQELGVAVPELGPTAESDIAGQIAILEAAVAAKPAALVIAPTHRTALSPALAAAARTVKIIGIDSPAETTAFAAFLATDNVQAGRLAADGLAEGIRARTGRIAGDIALLTALPGAGSLEERARGFREQVAAKYPELRIRAEREADGQAATGGRIAADLLAAQPPLAGLFASNLTMTQGAAQALAQAKAQGAVTLIGFDSDAGLAKALADGTIAGLVLQDPFRIGYDGIKTALAAARGEPVAPRLDTGALLVTPATMASPRARELLGPPVD